MTIDAMDPVLWSILSSVCVFGGVLQATKNLGIAISTGGGYFMMCAYVMSKLHIISMWVHKMALQ